MIGHDKVRGEVRSVQRPSKLKGDQTKRKEVDEEDSTMTEIVLLTNRNL